MVKIKFFLMEKILIRVKNESNFYSSKLTRSDYKQFTVYQYVEEVVMKEIHPFGQINWPNASEGYLASILLCPQRVNRL